MTRFLALLAIGVVLILPVRLHAAAPDDFRFLAALTGTLSAVRSKYVAGLT